MTKENKKKGFQLPNTYVIIAIVVLVFAILSWIVPPGTYDYEKVEINVVHLGIDDIVTASQPNNEDTDFEGGQSPW